MNKLYQGEILNKRQLILYSYSISTKYLSVRLSWDLRLLLRLRYFGLKQVHIRSHLQNWKPFLIIFCICLFCKYLVQDSQPANLFHFPFPSNQTIRTTAFAEGLKTSEEELIDFLAEIYFIVLFNPTFQPSSSSCMEIIVFIAWGGGLAELGVSSPPWWLMVLSS